MQRNGLVGGTAPRRVHWCTPNGNSSTDRADMAGGRDVYPGMPWASRLEVAELIELARRNRIELGIANPRKLGRDGWMGPVPPEATRTLLHNVRWWCSYRQAGMPFCAGTAPSTLGEKVVLAFSNDRIYHMQRDAHTHPSIGRLRGGRDHDRRATFERRRRHGGGDGRPNPP